MFEKGVKPQVMVMEAGLSTVGLLFPGEGSQYLGMLNTLKDNPQVLAYNDIARSVLGYDLLKVCLEGPEEKLMTISVCHPALFLADMAGLEKLRVENPYYASQPGAVAGLSLGEYAALCVAGVFTFEEGLELVKVRAEAIEAAAALRPQTLLSVAGIERDVLEQLCEDQTKGDEVCTIAQVLFPKGYVCGGTCSALEALQKSAEEAKALQTRLSKDSPALNTSFMRPAQDKIKDAIQVLLPKMKPPTCDIYMNATGQRVPRGSDPEDFMPLLQRQVSSTALWEPLIRLMIKDGVKPFYEVGPQKQLKSMMKRIDDMMGDMTVTIQV